MRTHIIAASLLVSAPVAFAQTVIAPPVEAPPGASAPIDERADWCDEYATWLVALTPSAQPTPTDVRPTQRARS